MNQACCLRRNETLDANICSWIIALSPSIPEVAVPCIALSRPDLFPLPDVGILDFTDPLTFSNHHFLSYLRVVHSQRLRAQFSSENTKRDNINGQSGPRIGVARVNDVLTLHLPNVTLPPSVAGYRMGETTARLAEEIRDRIGQVTVFEMGVGGGIIMSSTVRNFHNKGLLYVGGDIDDTCLDATDVTMQINGFDPSIYKLKQGCVLEPIHGTGADIIVSNPPYYPRQVAERLSGKVGPKLSTDGGSDGLDFYRAILRESAEGVLNSRGKILLQVPNQRIGEVKELAKDEFGVNAKVSVPIAPSSKEKGVLVELI